MNSREEKMRETHEEIENDILREKQKKITILFIKIIIVTFIIIISFFLYIKYIETAGLLVRETRIVSNKLPESFNSAKIIQFSDLYYGSTIYLDEVKKLVDKINLRNPDIVIFTGNLLNDKYNISEKEEKKLVEALNKINAPIGKYAILSSDDFDDAEDILRDSNFNILENESELIYKSDEEPILLTALNSNNENDIKKAFEYFEKEENNKNIYNILLLESPDDIDSVTDKTIDLALAGKSLNGGICLKEDLCFIKTNGAKKYYQKYYNVNNIPLYISSGIGTRDINFRFVARPSINFFRLSK